MSFWICKARVGKFNPEQTNPVLHSNISMIIIVAVIRSPLASAGSPSPPSTPRAASSTALAPFLLHRTSFRTLGSVGAQTQSARNDTSQV